MKQHEKIVVSIYTGILMCPFSKVHEECEKLLNRPIYTHEFASEKLCDELKEKVKPEFLKICNS